MIRYGVNQLVTISKQYSIRRDKMLEAVRDLARDIYPLVHSAYSAPTSLLWEVNTIKSAEEVQQGDPLGRLLFCLTLHRHFEPLCSPLCVMYLDDTTVGGSLEDVLHDLQVIKEAEVSGLSLNNSKSEMNTFMFSDLCFSRQLQAFAVIKTLLL